MTASDGRRQMWVEWISVKDRLPPCAATVLVYVPETGMRLRAFYLPNRCLYNPGGYPGEWREDSEYGGQSDILAEITHWMELPPAPEGA